MISVAVPQRRAKKLGLLMLLGFLALLLQPLGLSAQVPDLGGRLEIFVDRFLIERLRGAELKLHEPESAGVVLRFDRPWEGAFCGYATVIKDGPAYRLYYRGLPTAGQDGSHEEVTCYAESADGIDWKKLNLGLFEVRGTRDNNVILQARGVSPDNQQSTFEHNRIVDTRLRFPDSVDSGCKPLPTFRLCSNTHRQRSQQNSLPSDLVLWRLHRENFDPDAGTVRWANTVLHRSQVAGSQGR